MTTYSQLVDEMILELRRHDLKVQIGEYLNQTLREVHFSPLPQEQNAVIYYRENFREALLAANLESGFGWDIPDPAVFQAMQVVKYLSGCEEYPPELIPSRGLKGREAFYYRAGSHYSFAGYGGLNAAIAIGYYEYPRRLRYYEPLLRPAEYDSDLGWTYAEAFDQSEETRLAAREYCSNWLLLRWDSVIKEGVRAKVYKRIGDDPRARTCYSLYMSLRAGLMSSESYKPGGYA